MVTRGIVGPRLLACFRGCASESRRQRYLLIKGPFCFVYSSVDAAAPRYAVGLHSTRPSGGKTSTISGPNHGHAATSVLLENSLGDVEYEFVFSSEEAAIKFRDAVERQTASAQTEQVRKRLGHDRFLSKRDSVRYAERVAKAKEREQPDVPVTTAEIIAHLPSVYSVT
jgi:hypothetical protein